MPSHPSSGAPRRGVATAGLARPHARSLARAAERAGPDTGRPVRVLVVEDEYFVALGIAAELGDAGFEVVDTVARGEDAIAVAAREHPQLAIVDIRLAGRMDGIETARILLSEHGVRSIFATAYCDDDTRARARAARPLGWLSKPYLMDGLVGAVESALSSLH